MHDPGSLRRRLRCALVATLALGLAACPESPGLAPVPVPDASRFAGVPFAQTDLAGDWRYAAVFHGAGVIAGTARGWERGTLRIGSGGAVSVLSASASDGSTWSSAPPTWNLDTDGFVTAAPGSYVGFHLKLNAGRTLAAGTGTTAGTSAALWVLARVSAGTSFSAADLAGTSWAYHRLVTGTAPSWEHGIATVDGTGLLSLTARVTDSGAQPDLPSVATLTVNADGTVSLAAYATWLGVLSADKKLLVTTQTIGAGAQFALEVWVRRGQTYQQSDLAGRSSSHAIVAASNGAAGWSQGVFTVDATGQMTPVSMLTNAGQTTLSPPQTLTLAPDGTVTSPQSPTSHSTFLYTKDGSAHTSTTSTYAQFGVNVR